MTSNSHPSPTSSSKHRASANTKTGMHSILDAAYGLTSLGSPSLSSQQTPRPSSKSNSTTPPIKYASEARLVTQDVPKPILMDSTILREVPPLKPVPKSFAEMSMPPSARYSENVPLPSYATAVGPAAARSFVFKNSPQLSPLIQPHQTAAGFESLHYSDAAMAIDRYSVSQRIAMMDKAAAMANPGLTAIARYPYNHPSNSYQQKVPASSPFQSILDLDYENQATSGPNTKNFPELLFQVLSADENAHIISWLPHGKGFIIHDKQRFNQIILPRYFDGAKFTSFTRRLKRWSFVRIPRGPELGAYSHRHFQRDEPELLQQMRYKAEKGRFAETGKKASKKLSGPEEDKEKNDSSEDETKTCNTHDGKAVDTKDKKLKELVKNKVEAKFQEGLLKNERQALMEEVARPTSQKQKLPSALPTVPKPQSSLPSDPNRRMVDIQQDVMQARSMLAHQIASGRLSGSSLGPEGTLLRYGARSSMPGYTATVPHAMPQRMTDVEIAERTKRIIEVEQMLGLSSVHCQQLGQGLALEIPAPYKAHYGVEAHYGVMDTSKHNFSRLAPPFIHQGNEARIQAAVPISQATSVVGTELGSKSLGDAFSMRVNGEVAAIERSTDGRYARAVMMTREEEEGFARYQYMKRNSQVSAVV